MRAETLLRQVGVALELPFELLVKHFTASYSAARAALLDAWRFFRTRRDFMATYFCQPIYTAWMEEAVAIGRVDAPGFFDDPMLRRAYLGAEWMGDGPGSINPKDEAQAIKTRLDTIDRLNAYSVEPANPMYPAAWPLLRTIEYDAAMDGDSTMTIGITVAVAVMMFHRVKLDHLKRSKKKLKNQDGMQLNEMKL